MGLVLNWCSPGFASPLLINEVDTGSVDAVEIYNPGGDAVDLTHLGESSRTVVPQDRHHGAELRLVLGPPRPGGVVGGHPEMAVVLAHGELVDEQSGHLSRGPVGRRLNPTRIERVFCP